MEIFKNQKFDKNHNNVTRGLFTTARHLINVCLVYFKQRKQYLLYFSLNETE